MALSNRQELIDAMVDWLNRAGSSNVKNRCEDFIALHEARANRVLREREMTANATATLSEGRIRLPNDWAETKQLQINSGSEPMRKPQKLSLLTEEQADDLRQAGTLTYPRYYVITGNHLEVVPYTTEPREIEMTYYRKVPALTAGAPTNWLLQAHPDYYLYGSLVHSAPYLRDDERITTWGTLAQAAQDEMLLACERAKHSGSRLRTRSKLRY